MTVAHGQMEEKPLEKVMLEFLRGGADVLVCTSIVESGLDIANANTLIVERADQLGLAQLYQIRGRVGRSRERAYAYLFYPSSAALTEEAAARLSTLSDYTELGSGFKIAMRDLEIRGAGNLLGDEQSGHVAAVGFELYMGMLDEAVAALRATGDEPPEPVGWTYRSTPTCPATTCPTRRRRSRSTAGCRRAGDRRPDHAPRGARGPLRAGPGAAGEPHQAAGRADQARARRRRGRDFSGGRLAVAPLELDSRGRESTPRELPGAIYESAEAGERARARRSGGALPGRRRRCRGDTQGRHGAAMSATTLARAACFPC